MAAARKICMLGDFAVGKTSLVRRYVLNMFSADYHATIGVNIYKYADTVDMPDGSAVALNQVIWDIEGNEDRTSLLSTYVHGAAGAIICADVTRDGTIASLTRHARFFLEQRPGRPVVFAINKADLLGAGDRPPDTRPLADTFGAPVVLTSALSGDAVQQAFRDLGRVMLQRGT